MFVKFTKEKTTLPFLICGALVTSLSNQLLALGVNSKLISLVFVAWMALFCLGVFAEFCGHDSRDALLRARFAKPILLLTAAFGAYYVAITAYRIVTHGEAMESVHYAYRLIGSLALYLLYARRTSWERFLHQLAIFIAAFDLAIPIVTLIAGTYRGTPLLGNVITVNGFMLLSLPVACMEIRDPGHRALRAFGYFHIFLIVLAAFLSGSRLMLVFGALALLAALIYFMKNGRALITICALILVGGLVIFGLYRAGVGDTVMCVDKQLISIRDVVSSVTGRFGAGGGQPEATPAPSATAHPDATPAPTDTPVPEATPAVNEEAAMLTIGSDMMRANLVQMGLDEIRKQPLIGTGDIFYEYDFFGVGEYVLQSSHNFLIESMVSFGAIGCALLVAVGLCCVIHLFAHATRTGRFLGAYILVVYFGFGMMEPLVYDGFIMPYFFCMAAFLASAGAAGKRAE